MAQLKNLSTLISALELQNLTKTPTFVKQYRIIEAGMGEEPKKKYEEEYLKFFVLIRKILN